MTEHKDLTSYLQSIASSINEEMNYSAVGYLDNYTSDVSFRIPTGCSVLDRTLNGGLPGGRIVEMVGWESSGKSTVGYSALIGVQKKGGLGILIDAENSFHKDRFEAMGGSLNSLIVVAPVTIEDAIVSMIKVVNEIKPLRKKKILDENAPVLIFWDTLHASTTSKIVESENKTGDKNLNLNAGGMAERARIIQNFFRFATLYLPHNKACLLIANQLIANVTGYGAATGSSGGNALRFYPSIRMRCKSLGPYKEGDLSVGMSAELSIFKNKVDAPLGTCTVPIRYDTGIDNDYANFQWLVNEGYIVRKGSWYKFVLDDDTHSFYEKDLKKLHDKIPEFSDMLATMVERPEFWQSVEDGLNKFLPF